MRRLSIILIILGISIAAIPPAGQAYMASRQRQLVEEWERQVASDRQDTSLISKEYMELNRVFSDSAKEAANDVAETPEKPETPISIEEEKNAEAAVPVENISAPRKEAAPEKTVEPKKKTEPKKKQKVLGMLEIRKIHLKVPIVEGAGAESLKVGVGHIPGTASFGEIGNTALAGHRNYTFAHYFKYLDRMKPGDQIIISTGKKTYSYRVYESLVVEPDDMSVLETKGEEKLLTLVTCHPYYRATQRLIIHARLE